MHEFLEAQLFVGNCLLMCTDKLHLAKTIHGCLKDLPRPFMCCSRVIDRVNRSRTATSPDQTSMKHEFDPTALSANPASWS